MSDFITEPDGLLGVEIRHLAALAAIAETGSFSAAGRRLGYAQSAVSQQIAALERATGHRLLERPGGPKPVTLTEAGALMLVHAGAITARLSAIRADLDRYTSGATGRLRVGVFQSASARLLPVVLPRFRERWPHIEVSLMNEFDAADVEKAIAAGDIDIAFCELEAVTTHVSSVELLADPLVVVVGRDHPLATRVEVTWTDLEGFDRVSYAAAVTIAHR